MEAELTYSENRKHEECHCNCCTLCQKDAKSLLTALWMTSATDAPESEVKSGSLEACHWIKRV